MKSILDTHVHLVVTVDAERQASAMVPADRCLDAAREFAAILPRSASIALYHADAAFGYGWRRSGIRRTR